MQFGTHMTSPPDVEQCLPVFRFACMHTKTFQYLQLATTYVPYDALLLTEADPNTNFQKLGTINGVSARYSA